MKLLRYRRPSLKTVLGVTKVKKRGSLRQSEPSCCWFCFRCSATDIGSLAATPGRTVRSSASLIRPVPFPKSGFAPLQETQKPRRHCQGLDELSG
jgi:hypothetical protein